MANIVSERPIFNVAQLLREPVGATRTGQVEVDLRDLTPELAPEAESPNPVLRGPVRLMHVTDGVLAQGEFEAEVVLPCSRCLEPVLVPIEVQVEETFVPTIDVASGQQIEAEETDEALRIDEHHILDLSEVLRQDVLVALPMHVVCRGDCRGLCPTCGKNLNEGPCECEVEPDPRWARLTELLKNQNNESSEKE